MSEARSLTEVLSVERPRLIGLAYRITGSRLDAEDIVQDAWLRAERADWSAVERPEAWLTTVVSRLALDRLKSAQRQRETYVGPWLPEPVVTERLPGDVGHDSEGETADPADLVELAESLTFGFLRLMESLQPLERVVFILADVFDTPYRDIAAMVQRKPEACRQIASRARRQVRATDRRHDPPDDAEKVAGELAIAIALGDVDQVVALLAEDVVVISDGGADRHAARRPVLGPFRAARYIINLSARAADRADSRFVPVNSEPGAVIYLDGEPYVAASIRVEGGLVREVHFVVNPDKLAALDLTTLIL